MALTRLLAVAARCALITGAILSAAAQPINPVSSANAASTSAAGGSFLPVFSEEGQHIAFLSYANNLVPNDDSGPTLDIFLFNLGWQTNELVTVNTTRRGGGNSDSTQVSVSRYGTLLTFVSRSSNLTTNDTNNAVDVFVRSRIGVGPRVTRVVSVDRFGSGLIDAVPVAIRPLSSHPSIGRDALPPIVFQSFATNLVSLTDANNSSDVFIRDSQSGALALVSVASSGDSTGAGLSHSPQLAGSFVGFISTATNLHMLPSGVATNSNRGGDIYVREWQQGRTYWASPNTRNLLAGPFPAPPSSYSCFNFAVAGGNGAVVYQASAGPATATVLLYCPLGAPAANRVSADSDHVGRPHISWNGDVVAYSSRSNVYVWNRQSGSNVLVSVNTNGMPANGPSHSPVIHPDGLYVTFISRATDLVTNVLSGGFQIYVRTLPAGPTRLVTVNTNGVGSIGDFELSNIAIAPEGPTHVAFDSTAPDLVPGDFNGASDVFVRDFNRNETILVSRQAQALPANTSPLMSGVAPNSVSADGRVVAFTSLDDPFAFDDTNVWQDVFVRHLAAGPIQRISGQPVPSPSRMPQAAVEPVVSAEGGHVVYSIIRGSNSGGAGDRYVFWYDLLNRSNRLVGTESLVGLPAFEIYPPAGASVSSNGNLVVFQSTESVTPLVRPLSDGNSGSDIFSRDMTTGETKLISVDYTGFRSGNGASSNAVLSPNDRWVVFQSVAGNIVSVPDGGVSGGPTTAPGYLYARDLLSNTSRVASAGRNAIGSNVAVAVRGPALFSGDSEWIGYVVTNNEVYVRNLLNGTTRPVCDSCAQPRLNHDASFVAYETLTNNDPAQVWVKNTITGLAKLLSASLSGLAGNGPSSSPQISPNGRFVVFQSLASDLAANDTNRASDIFVADRLLGSVVLLTINRAGTASANGSSSKPVLSADGRTMVFQSLASDLIVGDYNDRRDVFYATLSLPDSDTDGMDDDFEITYFGNLDRRGTGDMDNDGQTDLQEFLAGTNPTSDASILRVITLNLTGAETKQLIWSAAPGRTYQVQYKDDLNDPWSTLPGTTRAISTTAVRSDSTTARHRYYRVVLAE